MPHPLHQKHFHNVSNNDCLNLEPYIHVDKERITRNRVRVHGIHFQVDQDILASIQQAQETGRHL